MANIALDLRRHMELFNPFEWDMPIHIIGGGATGSWLALFLAKLGITDITVWDYDTVEEHNVPNQAFGIRDVGVEKVFALREMIHTQTGTAITVKNEKYVNQRLSGFIFCMVDSMATRKSIWLDNVKRKSAVKHFVEPRMGLDGGRVYNVNPMSSYQAKMYEATLYSDEEAEVSACGASMSVITTAVTTASWCARQLIEFSKGEKLNNEILLDLKYNNVVTYDWEE